MTKKKSQEERGETAYLFHKAESFLTDRQFLIC
jgi:hypothetical protein